MIVYRQAETLAQDLGIPVRTLYAVSNDLARHYRTVELPKGDGTVRKLSVPSPLLKTIQRRITERLLVHMPVSPYATAYRYGGSPLRNAAPHVGQPMVLNLDIYHFFDNVLYSAVKEAAFPAYIYAEPLRILLTMLCYHGESLPQGAPSSPAISNLILRDFDLEVGSWCKARNISYTRYCDDMTFSGDLDPREIVSYVETTLRTYGFFLNRSKTRWASPGQRQAVTGLVVNEKVSVPSAYRRQLRQEIRFCQRFGVEDHLRRTCSGQSPEAYLQSLLGRAGYLLQVSPDSRDARAWRAWILTTMKKSTE